MLKKVLLTAIVAAGAFAVAAPSADAGVFYRRVAPVRRVAARVALPPYPIARRAVIRPRMVAPVAAPVWSAPVVYGPGVFVGVGY